MKSAKITIVSAFVIICVLIAAAVLRMNALDSAAIGIIGGADGPTSIYIASSHSAFRMLKILIPVLLIAAALILIYIKKRRNSK